MRTRTFALITGAVSAALLAGGCKSISQEEYDAAIAENNQLRDRIDTLQSGIRDAEADKDALRGENSDLLRENDQLRAQVSAMPVAGGGTAPTGPAGMRTRPSDVVLEVAGDVLFSSGQTTLTREGKAELDRIARIVLREFPSNLIRVEGYTDSDPIRKSKWGTNERLSAERALAVETYLVSRGIDAEQIYSAALGPANRRATKKDSRRVEIVILSGN